MKNRLNDDIAFWHWAKARQSRGGTSWSAYWATREPSALILTVVSDVRIDATWTDSAVEGADGYKVYISTDNATWTLHDTVSVGDEASSITGLTQATIYYVKVVAYKGVEESTGISDFQLTLPAAFVGGVANTKRYVLDDASLITKDVNNFITVAEEKYSSGEDLAPVGTDYPLWTAEGMKVVTYGSYQSILTKAFTLVQPCEIYMLVKLPTWGNNRFFMTGAAPAGNAGFRQITSTPKVEAWNAFGSSDFDCTLNTWKVVYQCLSNVYGKDIFGVDLTEEVDKNIGDNNPGGIAIGGGYTRAGIVDTIINEVVVRDALSSATDRAGIVRYLMNKAAFFLT